MNFATYPFDTQVCELRYVIIYLMKARKALVTITNQTSIILYDKLSLYYYKCFRLLSFGHTLSHNKYVWHGGVEADHVVISGYSLALEKGTLVYKVTIDNKPLVKVQVGLRVFFK